MAELGSKYSERQIALIKGETPPATNEEWQYTQDHANDILPGSNEDLPVIKSNINGPKRMPWRNQSTQAGYIGEALDAKDS